MKRKIKSMFSIFVLMAVLVSSAMSMTVSAANAQQAAGAVQPVFWYDMEADDIVAGTVHLGVLFRLNDNNIIITDLAEPLDSSFTCGFVTATKEMWKMGFVKNLHGDYNFYVASSSLGAEEGFLDAGKVAVGEVAYMVYLNDESEISMQKTKVLGIGDNSLKIDAATPDILPALLLNAEFEPCAVVFDDKIEPILEVEDSSAPAQTTPAETTPAETTPAETTPAETVPEAEGPAYERIPSAIPLPSKEEIIRSAQRKPAGNSTLYLVIGGSAVLVVLAAAILVVLKKRKKESNAPYIPQKAEEGTVLNDEFTGGGELQIFLDDGSVIPINGTITVGRDSDNMLVTDRTITYVSGHHCVIEQRGGSCWLRDISSNGTFIDGSRVQKNQPVRLQSGMRIDLGKPNSSENFRIISNSDTVM